MVRPGTLFGPVGENVLGVSGPDTDDDFLNLTVDLGLVAGVGDHNGVSTSTRLPGARSATSRVATATRTTRLAGATARTGNLGIDKFGESGPRLRTNTVDIRQILCVTGVFANVGSFAAGASGEFAFDVRIE